MRILLVSDSYPPLIGGANRGVQQLAQELSVRGDTVCVATSWQEGLPRYEEDGDVVVHRLRDLTSRLPWLSSDPYVHTPPPFPDPEATWRLRRLIRQYRPDIVHTYGWLSYSCVVAMWRTEIPFLVSARDYSNICALRTLLRHNEICDGPALRKCLECASDFYGRPKGVVAVVGVLGGRKLLRLKATGLHSCSGYVQQVMNRHLFGGKRRTGAAKAQAFQDVIIPDFHVDPAGIGEPEPMLLDRLPKEPFILYVGALRLVKGLKPLLAAYELLDDPPPLVLMGHRAPDTPESFPKGVTVINDVPYATVLASWDRALFGVAPSILPEPLGNVVHEGMSRGRAVIGTRPGGHGDMIVDGRNGLLVPAGDAGALADAMRRLIDDPAERVRMEAAARVRSEYFTSTYVMPSFEALYADALRASPLLH